MFRRAKALICRCESVRGATISDRMAELFEFRLYPSFQFRGDLAEEIGFADAMRSPQRFEIYAARHSHMSPGALELAYEDNCRTRQMLQLGRFFGLHGRRSCAGDPIQCYFTDGAFGLPVPIEGLFRECMVRANAALGRLVDGPYAIIPDEADTRVPFPQGFVFYDNKAGYGYVLPWNEYSNVNWRVRVDD